MVALPFFRIYGAGAVWLSLRSILGRAREHANGRGGLLFFSLIVRPRDFFFRPPPPPPPPQKKPPATQSMIGYDEGTYSATFMRVSKQVMNLPETDQGRGR